MVVDKPVSMDGGVESKGSKESAFSPTHILPTSLDLSNLVAKEKDKEESVGSFPVVADLSLSSRSELSGGVGGEYEEHGAGGGAQAVEAMVAAGGEEIQGEGGLARITDEAVFMEAVRGREDWTEEEFSALFTVPHKWMVHPNHPRRQIFDMVMAAALVYMCLVIPFRVCFSVEATGFFFVFESMIDFLFLFDLVLNFRTAYFSSRGVLVSRPRAVAKHYLKTWFVIDFISAFPLDLVVLIFLGDDAVDQRNLLRVPRMVRMIRLIRLVRLFRLFRLSRLYRKFQSHVDVNSAVFTLIKLFVGICLLAHFLACFYFLVAVLQPEGTTTWTMAYGIDDSYVLDQYITSLYFAVQAVASLGLGDITPQTTVERVYVIFVVTIGVGAYSYAVGSMSFLVQHIARNPVQEKIDAVNNYMAYRQLPNDLQVAIREHYLFSWRRHHAVRHENRILSELSSSLRTQIALFLYQKNFASIKLFDGTSNSFITELISRFKPQAAAPGEVIVRQGEFGDGMYVIIDGKVEVVSQDGSIVLAVLGPGAYFGEAALVDDSTIRSATIRALTYTDLDKLTRTEFVQILVNHPDEIDKLGIVRDANVRKQMLRRLEMARSTPAGMGIPFGSFSNGKQYPVSTSAITLNQGMSPRLSPGGKGRDKGNDSSFQALPPVSTLRLDLQNMRRDSLSTFVDKNAHRMPGFVVSVLENEGGGSAVSAFGAAGLEMSAGMHDPPSCSTSRRNSYSSAVPGRSGSMSARALGSRGHQMDAFRIVACWLGRAPPTLASSSVAMPSGPGGEECTLQRVVSISTVQAPPIGQVKALIATKLSVPYHSIARLYYYPPTMDLMSNPSPVTINTTASLLALSDLAQVFVEPDSRLSPARSHFSPLRP